MLFLCTAGAAMVQGDRPVPYPTLSGDDPRLEERVDRAAVRGAVLLAELFQREERLAALRAVDDDDVAVVVDAAARGGVAGRWVGSEPAGWCAQVSQGTLVVGLLLRQRPRACRGRSTGCSGR